MKAPQYKTWLRTSIAVAAQLRGVTIDAKTAIGIVLPVDVLKLMVDAQVVVNGNFRYDFGGGFVDATVAGRPTDAPLLEIMIVKHR